MLVNRYDGAMRAAAETVHPRGRPREFDEDAVLDAVVRLFHEKGYEAASLADIVEVAGLNKSSLYGTFGSKEQLFELALRRYIDERSRMLDLATGGTGGLDDVMTLLEIAEAESTSEEGRRGCMAVNSTAELGFASAHMVDLAQEYRTILRVHIRKPLDRAAAAGEIDASLVPDYTETILSFMLTAMLSARGGASDGELRDHFDALRRLVRSWCVD